MSHRRKLLTALAAAAIAVGSLTATAGGASAMATTAAPHYKPLICVFFPFLDVCKPAPKKVVHHHHHKTMMKSVPKPK